MAMLRYHAYKIFPSFYIYLDYLISLDEYFSVVIIPQYYYSDFLVDSADFFDYKDIDIHNILDGDYCRCIIFQLICAASGQTRGSISVRRCEILCGTKDDKKTIRLRLIHDFK